MTNYKQKIAEIQAEKSNLEQLRARHLQQADQIVERCFILIGKIELLQEQEKEQEQLKQKVAEDLKKVEETKQAEPPATPIKEE
jgi:CHASE3 domain sensor protein